MKQSPPYLLHIWTDANGRQPCIEWIEGELSIHQRAAVIAALSNVLAFFGKDVCESEYGKPLGDGLFEFRVRWSADEILRKAGVADGGSGSSGSEPVLLRVFFHPYGEKIVLLLGGYDKGDDPSSKRQQKEIKVARKMLTQFQEGVRRGGENPKRMRQADVPKPERFN